MIRALVAFIFAICLLLCRTASDAAVSLVQVQCSTSSPVVLATAPTNGNIVMGVAGNGASLVGAAFTDSNSVSYMQEEALGNRGGYLGLWDGVVTGSPTATYTFSVGTGTQTYCVYEISGATLTGAQYVNAANSGTRSMGITVPSNAANDFLLFASIDYQNPMGAAYLSPSTLTVDYPSYTYVFSGHAIASSSASNVFSINIVSTDLAVVFGARYTAVAAGLGSGFIGSSLL